jgi:hypothetical protein
MSMYEQLVAATKFERTENAAATFTTFLKSEGLLVTGAVKWHPNVHGYVWGVRVNLEGTIIHEQQGTCEGNYEDAMRAALRTVANLM